MMHVMQEMQHYLHAPQIWRSLQNTVEVKSRAETLSSTVRLNNLKMLKGHDIRWLFAQVLEIKGVHVGAKIRHPDSYYIPYILKALPKRFDNLADILMAELDTLTIETTKARLLAKEEQLNLKYQEELEARARQNQARHGKRPFAAVAKAGEGGAQQHAQQHSSGGGSAYALPVNAQHAQHGRFHGNCNNCGIYGHKAANCRKPKKFNNFKAKGGAFKKHGHHNHNSHKGGKKGVNFGGQQQPQPNTQAE